MNIIEALEDPNIREFNISFVHGETWNMLWKDASFSPHEEVVSTNELTLPSGVEKIAETKLVSTFSAPEKLVDDLTLNARIIILHDHDGDIKYISVSKTANPAFEEASPELHKLQGKSRILFSGGTGSGKTHLLNQFLHHYLPKNRAYFLIEEFEEINLPVIKHKMHRTIPFASPGEYLDWGAYLLNEANTSRVAGVVYGECKTPSVAEGLVLAANNGADVFSTIHAASPDGALKKLASLIFPNMSLDERLKMVAQNIECVVQLSNHEVEAIAYPTGAVTNGNVQLRRA